MMLQQLRRFFAYNDWANARLFDAASNIAADALTRDLRSSFPSIRDTLAHIVEVEWVWLERWRGVSPSVEPAWASGDLVTLRAQLQGIAAERAAFLDGLCEPDLLRRIAYINFKGDRCECALVDLLTHLVNHSTYHRGQITTMMRQVGAKVPPTDLLLCEDAAV